LKDSSFLQTKTLSL